MVGKKIIDEWLSKADSDFEFASCNLREENEFFAQICFHFHQASEKFLKAYIIAHNIVFEKTHDLVHLCEVCLENDSRFDNLKEECFLLNEFYIDTRYPVTWPVDFTRKQSQEAQKAAKKIGDFIKKQLGVV